MIARILCRLGLHEWKPVMRVAYTYMWTLSVLPPHLASYLRHLSERVTQTGHQCRRCGKRVSL